MNGQIIVVSGFRRLCLRFFNDTLTTGVK